MAHLLVLWVACGQPAAEAMTEDPQTMAVPLRYDLSIVIEPKEGEARVRARVTIRNPGISPISSISLLLYRLSSVESLTVPGSEASFSDQLVGLREFPNFQFRRLQVSPREPVRPGQAIVLDIKYTIALRGYAEVLPYLKDSIDPGYTLFRPETAYYPLVGGNRWAEYLAAQAQPVDYTLSVDAPAGLAVASGGRRLESGPVGERVIHRFASRGKSSRMDIAVAPFEQVEQEGLLVHVLPGHAAGARRLAVQLGAARHYFQSRLGDVAGGEFQVIEVPAGFGSQAGDGYLLQESAAFTDAASLHELFHELAHGWRISTSSDLARTRWFDEAVATYLELGATRALQGDEAATALANGLRARFAKVLSKRPELGGASFREYGTLELGDASYSKGAWSLLVMEQLMGEAAVDQVLRGLLARDKVASFDALEDEVRARCRGVCDAFLRDWFGNGKASTEFMLGRESAAELAERYRRTSSTDQASHRAVFPQPLATQPAAQP
ncbi:MAG: hypothetical protein A3E01_01595 [Gammaproteobacteria bacterium RIFCSPHIGHO2_12_FULL_63_22]|nr:MAG: hypothetical protein A3E01_01595 [Gammaproteobacteria bacterium RIFCSPHIGHO2_12_FULL_63_22]